MEDTNGICKKYLSNTLSCTFEDCNYKKICKQCAIDNKEQLKHLYDHFDNLTHTDDYSSAYKDQIKLVDEFGELNKVFLNILEGSNLFTNSIFQNLIRSRSLIANELNSALLEKYKQMTSELEEFAKIRKYQIRR